jgi:hypothetical protein
MPARPYMECVNVLSRLACQPVLSLSAASRLRNGVPHGFDVPRERSREGLH